MFGNKEDKAAKQQSKVDDYMNQRGLGALSPELTQQIRRIMISQAGNGLMEAGALLQGDQTTRAILNAAKIQQEQNWIIIKQLDQLINGRGRA